MLDRVRSRDSYGATEPSDMLNVATKTRYIEYWKVSCFRCSIQERRKVPSLPYGRGS
jgi:hypothetical protein